MVSKGTEPHLRSDALANRSALLDAAADLYARRGLEVTYDEIVCQAGVGRATLYRHFPTRDLLLAGILDRMLDELATIAESVPPDQTASSLCSTPRPASRNKTCR